MWFYHVQAEHIRQQVGNELAAIAELKAEQIDSWRKERLGDAKVLAENAFLAGGVAGFLSGQEPKAAEKIHACFRSLQENYHYYDVLLVNPQGKVFLSLKGTASALHEEVRQAVAVALRDREATFADLHVEEPTPTPRFCVVAPVSTGDEQDTEPLGAVILVCDARQFLYPFIQSWPVPSETAETLLVRREGNDVLFLNDLRFRPDAALKLRISLEQTHVPAAMAVLGLGGVTQGTDYRGVKVVAAAQPVPDSPWFIVAKMDAKEAFAVLRVRAIFILVSLLGLIAALSTIGLLLWQWNEKAHYRALYRSEEALRESQDRYRAFFEKGPDGVVILDPETGQIVEFNDQVSLQLGYTRQEFAALRIPDIDATEGTDEVHARIQRIIREGRDDFETRHRTKEGGLRDVHVTAQVIETGGRPFIHCIWRDVTLRKETETALALERRRLSGILRGTNVGTWEWNVQTGETVFNERWAEIVGYTLEELSPTSIQTWRDLAHPDDLEKSEQLLEKHFKGELDYYECEARMRHKDGSWVWVLDCGRVDTWAEDGRPLHMSGTHQDITQRKRAEEQLKREQVFTQAVLDSVPGLLYLYDEEGYLVRWNKKHEEMTGYAAEELKGMHILSWFAASESERVAQAVKRAFETGRGEVEANLITKDGRAVPFYLTGVTLSIAGKSYMTGIGIDITERKRVEEQLRRNEARLRNLVDILQYPAATTQAFLDFALDKAIELTESKIGYIYFYNEDRREFVLNSWSKDVMKECTIANPQTCYELDKTGLWGEAVRQKRPIIANDFQAAHPLKKGYPEGHARLDKFMTVPVFSGGKVVAVVGVANKTTDYTETDVLQLTLLMDSVWRVTEQRRTEEEKENLQAQLVQSQKMESVGRLAGGVAHDFNNMLNVILGHTEIMLENADPSLPFRASLEEVQKAAQRSADLTRQLLAFARRQTVAPRVLSLNEAVDGTIKMLRRLIGEGIDLAWIPATELWPVKIDPAQIEQILASLCINARDAIRGVGRITIETSNAAIDTAYCTYHTDFVPGDYTMLAVTDNGCGMDKETIEHLFEPFFTTKNLGEGVGLGLATVYGIVKQNSGFINVYSEPGQGTTFKIYLPSCGKRPPAFPSEEHANTTFHGQETILFVEDEPAILNLGKTILDKLGYRVLAAGTPGEAIRLAKEHAGEVHLLITDVVMPEMNGQDLAARLLSLYPNIKRLFMSGYTANIIAQHGVLDAGVHFIQKPFSTKELAAKIREVLG